MEKKYAFLDHESIQAIVHSLFRFQTLEQAQMVTNRLATEFTFAPKLSDPLDKKSFVLWVHSYEVTEEQKKLGFLGNFGRVSMVKVPKGKWTLTMTKIDAPINKHPLRKAVPRRHPNMGHPVIRAALRAKVWPSMQEAGAQLMKLHEEFPEISVPGLNKLKISAYMKKEKGASPIQRMELNVVKKDEGVYVIEVKNVTRGAQPKRSIMPPSDDVPAVVAPLVEAASLPEKVGEDGKPSGFYTNLVTKGRKRKKK